MNQEENQKQGELTPYQRWYERNKEKFNEKRRKRYQQDPKYRKRQQKYLAESRSRARSRRQAPVPDGRLSVRAVAEEIGRDVQTIRAWEQRGLIPKSVNERGHRVYTEHQLKLLKDLRDYLSTYSPQKKTEFKIGLKAIVSHLKGVWDGGQI